ncbi:MAG: helix-turn-helix domain-containing protein [Actinomycetota bacterium]
MRKDKIGTQACSIARSAAVIGDAWVLLILREAFFGNRRFGDFVAFTGAQPSVVSDRLKRLVDAGVLEQTLYDEHPPRYEYRLTAMGRDLQPVLMTLTKWGDTHLDAGGGPPLVNTHTACGHDADPTVVCGHCSEPLTPSNVRSSVGPGADADTVARRTDAVRR